MKYYVDWEAIILSMSLLLLVVSFVILIVYGIKTDNEEKLAISKCKSLAIEYKENVETKMNLCNYVKVD